MTSGVIETTRALPALSSVLNSTRVPAPKLVPTSSITWSTLAAACAPLAATPLPATAITWVKVALGTATLSSAVLTRYTCPCVEATHKEELEAKARPEISFWLMPCRARLMRRSSTPARVISTISLLLVEPIHRLAVTGSMAMPDQPLQAQRQRDGVEQRAGGRIELQQLVAGAVAADEQVRAGRVVHPGAQVVVGVQRQAGDDRTGGRIDGDHTVGVGVAVEHQQRARGHVAWRPASSPRAAPAAPGG